jgi:hypothetical protein
MSGRPEGEADDMGGLFLTPKALPKLSSDWEHVSGVSTHLSSIASLARWDPAGVWLCDLVLGSLVGTLQLGARECDLVLSRAEIVAREWGHCYCQV